MYELVYASALGGVDCDDCASADNLGLVLTNVTELVVMMSVTELVQTTV